MRGWPSSGENSWLSCNRYKKTFHPHRRWWRDTLLNLARGDPVVLLTFSAVLFSRLDVICSCILFLLTSIYGVPFERYPTFNREVYYIGLEKGFCFEIFSFLEHRKACLYTSAVMSTTSLLIEIPPKYIFLEVFY